MIEDYSELMVDPISGETFQIDLNTGERVKAYPAIHQEGGLYWNPQQIRKYFENRQQRKDFFEHVGTTKTLGKFCQTAANQRFSDISSEAAARLIFLSTYLKYNSSALYASQRTAMKRKDLPQVLSVSAATTCRFFEEVAPKYLREDSKGYLHMNTDFFRYGEKGIVNSGSHQKIYMESVRKLYRTVKNKRHKHLGYIFQMLPFINIEYNVLCWNRFEKDSHHIQFLTEKEFCREIGYDYGNIARLRQIYRDMRFEVSVGNYEPFCGFVTTTGNTKIFVNPHIIYSGSRWKEVKLLGDFCRNIPHF